MAPTRATDCEQQERRYIILYLLYRIESAHTRTTSTCTSKAKIKGTKSRVLVDVGIHCLRVVEVVLYGPTGPRAVRQVAADDDTQQQSAVVPCGPAVAIQPE